MNGGWTAGVRGVIAAASIGLCVGGVGMVTQGVAVPLKAEVAQDGLERVFHQRLAASQAMIPAHARAPARPGNTTQQTSPQTALLPTTGPIARLSVERLGVKQTVLAGEATHDHLARGPVLLKRGDAANPITVLAAHRDTHFRFIHDLREGDEVALQLVTGETERYRITRFETVRWNEFAYPLDSALPLLALTTCYPFGGGEYGGPLRRVAWAAQIT